MEIKENVPLKDLTTFKLGGNARYFTVVQSIEDLKECIKWSKVKRLPFFVIGGGSNILADEEGFDGLLIKNELKGVTFIDEGDYMLAESASGEDWDNFVATTVRKNIYGLQNMSGIPGTVGATPIQNVGAYGSEVKDSIHFVEVLNTETLELEIISNSDCRFSYRNSIFKLRNGKKYFITKVIFKLMKEGEFNIEYKDFSNYFKKNKDIKLTLKSVRDAVLFIRSNKFPNLNKIGCAGSFFKNPIITKSELVTLLNKYPNAPHFEVDQDHVKIPLAWILDNVIKCKGIKHGGVGVFEKQPLILVNFGYGTSKEIKELAKQITNEVYKKSKIKISPEVFYLTNTYKK